MKDYRSIKKTLEHVREINEWSSYVNKERFISYAMALTKMTEKEASALWRVWQHVSDFNCYQLDKVDETIIEAAVTVARDAYEAVCKVAFVYSHDKEPKTPFWKVYYRHGGNGELQQMTLNMLKSEDVIKCSMLLQQEDVEILYRLDFHEAVEPYERGNGSKKEKVDIYDGDIIFCSDKEKYFSWEDNSGAYLCTDGCYKRLMYTPGRGYLRRGEPDFEQDKDGRDCRYNSHVFNSYDRHFQVVGNIYTDCRVLKEGKEE